MVFLMCSLKKKNKKNLNSGHAMQPDLASVRALISEVEIFLTVNQFKILACVVSLSDICTVLQNLGKPNYFKINR